MTEAKYDCPTAEEIMVEARKIPGLARSVLQKEWDSFAEAYKKKYGVAPIPPRAGKWAVTDAFNYDWVVNEFQRFTLPDLEPFFAIRQKVRQVEQTFENGNLGQIDTAKGYMQSGGWDGQLATSFVLSFLTPMGPGLIPANQKKIAETLRMQMEATEAIYAAARTDALNLAKRTISALEAIDDCTGDDIGLGLAIVGAVVSVAGVALVPVTAGMSVAAQTAIFVSIEAVKGSIAVGDKFTPKDGEIPLGADTVDGVLQNMSNAMTEMHEKIKVEEDKIIGTLTNNYNSISAARQSAAGGKASSVIPVRPNLAVKMNDPGALTNGLD